jgi:hypothetical protein
MMVIPETNLLTLAYLMMVIPETNLLTLSIPNDGYSRNQSFDIEHT